MANWRGAVLLATMLCTMAGAAMAQQGPRLIDGNRIDNRVPFPARTTPQPEKEAPSPGGLSDLAPFMLKHIDVAGTSLPPSAIAQLSSRWTGQQIDGRGVATITRDLRRIYKDHDYALFTILVPSQDFADGALKLGVVEGHVSDVIIEGDTDGHDMRLASAYAGKIAAEAPLRQSTLERYLLLLGDIPGYAVSSAFEPTGQPGAVRLRLNMQHRRVTLGSAYNNLGPGITGRSQFEVNATVNNLLRQGESTQILYGFPDDFKRYQLYGLSHSEAIGSEGMTLGVSGSHLRTTPGNSSSGKAYTAGAQLLYPFVRGQHDNLFGTAGIDGLNSQNAILGQISTSERTRNIRAGLSGSRVRDDGTSMLLSGTVSVGLDSFGARSLEPFYGDPGYIKANLRGGYARSLPFDLSARVRAAGQAAPEALPSSEQMTFGGQDFGGGFQTASFAGDQAVMGTLELAYSLEGPLAATPFAQSETYGFLDGASLWNENDIFQPGHRTPSSAGLGLRLGLWNKAGLQFQAGKPLTEADSTLEGRGDGWLFTFQLRSLF